MKKISKKKKLKVKVGVYSFLLGFFSLSFIILAIIVGNRELKMYRTNNETTEALKTFEALANVEGSSVDYSSVDVKIGKYQIIGSIKITSIGLQYPILDRTTEESMMLSITKVAGPTLNSYGNVSLAGHHTRNGTLFGKLANVKLGDIIEISNSKNITVQYEVYDIYSVMPTYVDPVKTTDRNVREVTLISCIQNGRKRIIVKAIEI